MLTTKTGNNLPAPRLILPHPIPPILTCGSDSVQGNTSQLNSQNLKLDYFPAVWVCPLTASCGLHGNKGGPRDTSSPRSAGLPCILRAKVHDHYGPACPASGVSICNAANWTAVFSVCSASFLMMAGGVTVSKMTISREGWDCKPKSLTNSWPF